MGKMEQEDKGLRFEVDPPIRMNPQLIQTISPYLLV